MQYLTERENRAYTKRILGLSGRRYECFTEKNITRFAVYSVLVLSLVPATILFRKYLYNRSTLSDTMGL